MIHSITPLFWFDRNVEAAVTKMTGGTCRG